jgi:hypothetical protein
MWDTREGGSRVSDVNTNSLEVVNNLIENMLEAGGPIWGTQLREFGLQKCPASPPGPVDTGDRVVMGCVELNAPDHMIHVRMWVQARRPSLSRFLLERAFAQGPPMWGETPVQLACRRAAFEFPKGDESGSESDDSEASRGLHFVRRIHHQMSHFPPPPPPWAGAMSNGDSEIDESCIGLAAALADAPPPDVPPPDVPPPDVAAHDVATHSVPRIAVIPEVSAVKRRRCESPPAGDD